MSAKVRLLYLIDHHTCDDRDEKMFLQLDLPLLHLPLDPIHLLLHPHLWHHHLCCPFHCGSELIAMHTQRCPNRHWFYIEDFTLTFTAFVSSPNQILREKISNGIFSIAKKTTWYHFLLGEKSQCFCLQRVFVLMDTRSVTLPDKNLWKTQQPMINIRQFIRLGYCEDNISVRKDKCQFAHKFPSDVGSMHICVVLQNNPIFLNFFSVSREWDCTITQTHPQWCNVAKPVQLKPINFPIPLNFTHQQIDVQNKQVMWPVCFIYIKIQSWSCSRFHAVSYCLESRLWMCELDFKSFEA